MNTILKIFDNIGFKFKQKDNQFIQYKGIPAFSGLDNSHAGYYIPYLARNASANLWEVGVGLVTYDDIANVVVMRHKVVKSSANDSAVTFTDPDKCEFYLFANQSNFDTGFANTIVINKSIHAYNCKATYLVDTTDQQVDIILPGDPLDNLDIEVKLVGGNNSVVVRENNGHIISVLSPLKSYVRTTYKNQWYVLSDNNDVVKFSTMASENNGLVSILSDPSGDPYSFQYNNGAGGFAGSTVYWGSGNKVLLGSDSESTAHTIIPTSGSGSVVFNSDRQHADFIVYGSGTRNLFFTYDGRLGLNIPSGSRPTTIFHVVNTLCQEGFRLENRNVCHPANMTLYHKPNGSLSNNTLVSQINLAAKNSADNKVDYAQIEAYSLNTTSTSEKGHLDLIVKSGATDLPVFSANPDQINIGYSGNNSLFIKKDGYSLLGYSGSLLGINSTSVAVSSTTMTFNGTTVSLQANSLTLGSGGSSITAQGSANIGSIQSSNITIPSIAASSILAVDTSNKVVVATGVTVNSYNTINFSAIPSGKFLTTIQNGTVTGIYDLDDYFYTDADIIWNKYNKRTATICLRQLTFDETVPLEEFSVGDQVAIESTGSTTIQYRFVTELDISSNVIAGMLLDQNVTATTTSNFKLYSVTKGGYLSISRDVQTGTIGNNSDIILSIRPGLATQFNTDQKNIDFKVYGAEQEPALYVKAHTDQPIVQSGYYHLFATRDDNIFAMIVTTGGIGLNNDYSSANFGYDVDDGLNLFTGILSDVGTNGKSSYYGTYDQNGNVAEWVEQVSLIDMTDAEEMVAGGSINTPNLPPDDNISPTGLRSIEFVVRTGCYDGVGFRISSVYNLTDDANIYASTGLNIDFASVTDPGNIADSRPFYIEDGGNFSLTSIDNLGVVDTFYRVSTTEITNSQYVKFLKAVATVDDRKLYDPRMYTDDTGGIRQIVLGGGDYDYTVKPVMDNKPVNFVSFISAIRFINWLHNGAQWSISESSVDETIDTGAYTVIPNGTNTHIVSKSRYRKYWLPNLNEWHKAAYFEPLTTPTATGVSAVMVRRSNPYTVLEDVTSSLYASMSVSGWLYVDHLIVGDNPLASSALPKRNIPPGSTDPEFACTTNSDCTGECEVCTGGFCAQSTYVCCVNDCCLAGTWNPVTQECFCNNCPDSGGGDDDFSPIFE